MKKVVPSMLDIASRAHLKMLKGYKCCVIPTGVCGSGLFHALEECVRYGYNFIGTHVPVS